MRTPHLYESDLKKEGILPSAGGSCFARLRCCWWKMWRRWKMGKSWWRKKGRIWRLLLGASGEDGEELGEKEKEELETAARCFGRQGVRRGILLKKNAAVEISRRHWFLALASYYGLPCILHRTAAVKKR
jgi:hypothetical protein